MIVTMNAFVQCMDFVRSKRRDAVRFNFDGTKMAESE